MPELPEVETIARGVEKCVRGDWIVDAEFSSKREPFKTAPAKMAAGLMGKRILQVRRVGKHLVCDLSAEKRAGKTEASAQWIVHLGMTGRLLVVPRGGAEREAHTHAVLHLQSGRELRFVDPRRFGRLEFRDLTQKKSTPFLGPGMEPLTVEKEAFAALFQGRKTSIKAALLNQKLLHGVGNIYADESLFRAGIRPRRLAGRLTRVELEKLRMSLQAVLKEAIARGGSSVSDYVDANGEKGFFQLEHRVYLRTGKPCRECGTPIERILITGRGTHYCPCCQR